MNRGLDFTVPRLYVLDGGKALHAAVKKYAGESAPIQRAGSRHGREQTAGGKKTERGVCDGRLRRGQTVARRITPRTNYEFNGAVQMLDCKIHKGPSVVCLL
jgi:hypothetical protein